MKQLKVWIEYGQKGLQQLRAGLSVVQQHAKKIGDAAEVTRARLQGIDSSLANVQRRATLALAAIATSFVALGTAASNTATKFEVFDAQLTTITRSAEKAKGVFKQLEEFTAKTPFQVDEVISSGVAFLSAREGDASRLIQDLRILGDTAAIAKVPLKELVDATNKLKQSGNFETETFARFNITRADLVKQGIQTNSAGAFSGASGDQLYEAALAAMVQKFEGGMERISRTRSGLISNLLDQGVAMLRELGEEVNEFTEGVLRGLLERGNKLLKDKNFIAGLREGFRELLETARPVMEAIFGGLDGMLERLQQNPQALVEGVRQFVSVVKDLTAALLAITSARIIYGLIMALASLVAVLGGGPIGIGIALVTGVGLVALFNMFRDSMGQTGSAASSLTGTIGSLTTGLDSTSRRVQETALAQKELKEKLRDTNQEVEEQVSWWQRLLDVKSLVDEKSAEKAKRQAEINLGLFELDRLGGVDLQTGSIDGRQQFVPSGEQTVRFSPVRDDNGKILQGRSELELWKLERQYGALGYKGQRINTTAADSMPDSGFSLFEILGRPAAREAFQKDYNAKRNEEGAAAFHDAMGFGLSSGKPSREASVDAALGRLPTADVAREAAKALTGLTDNTCAATLAEYFRSLGFKNVPDLRSTADAVAWLESIGAEQVDPADIKAGDVAFWKDIKNTTTGGGPNGLFDHTALAVGNVQGSKLLMQDNKSRSEVDISALATGYRIPDNYWFGANHRNNNSAAADVPDAGDWFGLSEKQVDELLAKQNTMNEFMQRGHSSWGTYADWVNRFTEKVESVVNDISSAAQRGADLARERLAELANIAGLRDEQGNLQTELAIASARSQGKDQLADRLRAQQMDEEISGNLQMLRSGRGKDGKLLKEEEYLQLQNETYRGIAQMTQYFGSLPEYATALRAVMQQALEQFAAAIAGTAYAVGGYSPNISVAGFNGQPGVSIAGLNQVPGDAATGSLFQQGMNNGLTGQELNDWVESQDQAPDPCPGGV